MPKVSVALDEQEHHTLMELAESSGLSHSAVFRRLLHRAQNDLTLLDAPEPRDLEQVRAALKALGSFDFVDRAEAWR